MKFNLIENAKDSLEHAIENLVDRSRPKEANLKRVIQNLSHTVELILKECLAREHPALVYTNIDNYPSMDANTVSTRLAVQRLEKIASVDFEPDDRKTIESSRKKRNAIEHFEFEIPTKEAEVTIGRLLSFILRFSEEELSLKWQKELFENPSWEKLKKHSDFWREHSNKVLNKMKERDADDCPKCDLFTFDMEKLQCQLCGHIDSYISCRACDEEYLESLDGVDGYHELCPKCIKADSAAFNHEKY